VKGYTTNGAVSSTLKEGAAMDKYKKIAEAAASMRASDGVDLAFAIFSLPLGVAGEWRVEEVLDSAGTDKLWTRTLYHKDQPVVRARSNGGAVAWVTRTWVSEEAPEEEIATLVAMHEG
jgi:hypothetical protein